MSHSNLAAVAEAAAATADPSQKTGATTQPVSTEAANPAAVSEAEAKGREAGAQAERDRLSAVFASDGIAGNAARMGHAMDLACNAPGMSVEKIVSMTTKHVGADAPATAHASLSNRQSDADPLGTAESGTTDKVSGIVANHRSVTGAKAG